MSGAVRSFLPELQRLDPGLAMPLQERTRVLRELEGDLEALHAELVASGLSDAEARERALELLVPDGASLRALRSVHAPFYKRMTSGLGGRRLWLIERSTLAVFTAGVILFGVLAFVRIDVFDRPSPFLPVVFGMGGVVLYLIASTVLDYWIKRDVGPTEHRPDRLLLFSGLTIGVGLFGTVNDWYRVAAISAESPELAMGLVGQWLVADAILLSIALLIALMGGLTWFLLTQWLAAVTDAHRVTVGADLHRHGGLG